MVYKFCSVNGGIGILENNFLKFSAPQDFNDPYDIAPTIQPYGPKDFPRIYGKKERLDFLFAKMLRSKEVASREEFDKYRRDPRFWALVLQRDAKQIQFFLDEYQGEIAKYFRVCCFSEVPTNLLMWAHYAKDFTGCVLGFDFDARPQFAKNLRKVQYRSKPVKLDVDYFYDRKYDKKTMDEIMVRKARDWSYERETRLIMTNDNLNSARIHGKEELGLQNASMYLKRVIVGARTEDKALHGLIAQVSKKLDIPIEVGALLRNSYKVEVNPLSAHMSSEQKKQVDQ